MRAYADFICFHLMVSSCFVAFQTFFAVSAVFLRQLPSALPGYYSIADPVEVSCSFWTFLLVKNPPSSESCSGRLWSSSDKRLRCTRFQKVFEERLLSDFALFCSER